MNPLDMFAPELRAAFEALVDERVAELRAELHAATAAPLPFMTIQEAADFYRCKRQRIDDLLSSGRLTRFKDGSRTLVSRQELLDHLNGRRSR